MKKRARKPRMTNTAETLQQQLPQQPATPLITGVAGFIKFNRSARR